jgi:uncharacterized protein YggE
MNNVNNYLNAIIVGIAIVIAGWFASSQADGVVSNGTDSPLMRDTVAVNGLGRVYAVPDILEANIGITENAKTTKEALAKTNEKVKQIIDIAVAEGVDKKDILTTNINMYPHYDYTNGRSVIDGYDSNQTLSIKIKKLETVATVLDKLSAVDGLQIQNTSYDIEDKEKVYEKARELAYQKAKAKADQLAKLAGVGLGKVISISDMTMDITSVPQYPMVRNAMADGIGGAGGGETSSVAAGEMVFDMSINVVYSID